jgi:hypothetical protein
MSDRKTFAARFPIRCCSRAPICFSDVANMRPTGRKERASSSTRGSRSKYDLARIEKYFHMEFKLGCNPALIASVPCRNTLDLRLNSARSSSRDSRNSFEYMPVIIKLLLGSGTQVQIFFLVYHRQRPVFPVELTYDWPLA